MPIVPIDLFLNALFTLFSCYLLRGTSPPNLPRDKGERLKRYSRKLPPQVPSPLPHLFLFPYLIHPTTAKSGNSVKLVEYS